MQGAVVLEARPRIQRPTLGKKYLYALAKGVYKKAPGLGTLTVTIAVPGAQVQGIKVSTFPPKGVVNETAAPAHEGIEKAKITTQTRTFKL